MKRIVVFCSIILSVLFLSVSCELGFSVDKPAVYVLTYGNVYGFSGHITEYKDLGMSSFSDDVRGSYSIGSLKSCCNDARDVANTFSQLAKKAGYNCTTATVLCSENPSDGVYSKFTAKLDEIRNRIKDNDILICYFSGHGASHQYGRPPISELSKDYLVFSNQLVDYDLVKYDIDSLRGTKVIICDSCYSGSLIPVSNGVTVNPDVSSKKPLKILFNSKIRESASMFVLTASRYFETSDDGSTSGNSVFTTSLLKALGGGRNFTSLGTIGAMNNNKLTIASVAKYVYDDMSDKNVYHIPVLSGRNDDLILFSF